MGLKMPAMSAYTLEGKYDTEIFCFLLKTEDVESYLKIFYFSTWIKMCVVIVFELKKLSAVACIF